MSTERFLELQLNCDESYLMEGDLIRLTKLVEAEEEITMSDGSICIAPADYFHAIVNAKKLIKIPVASLTRHLDIPPVEATTTGFVTFPDRLCVFTVKVDTDPASPLPMDIEYILSSAE